MSYSDAYRQLFKQNNLFMQKLIPATILSHSYGRQIFFTKRFSEINLERCDGPFQCKDKPPLYWTTAIAEEAGEICGAVKKLDRGFNEREFKKAKEKFLAETDFHDLPEKDRDAWAQLVYSDNYGDPNQAIHTIYQFWLNWRKQAIGGEVAGLLMYLDLFCQKMGIDMWESLVSEFNRVSNEMNCPQYKIQ